MQVDLSDKTILVTGASNGIGKAVAAFLMQMGARVAVHYHTNKAAAQDLIRQYPSTHSEVFSANLAEENEVISLFENVEKRFKTIDVILLNAGVFMEHPIKNTVNQWYAIWKKTMAINLNAVGLLTKLGIDHFKNRGEGRFIYIGSRAAFRGETQEYLAYAASKGGLVSLARSVARSFGKDNIKSFIVSPGFTRTQMAEQFVDTYGEEKIIEEIALNNLTKPEDLAPLIALLSSGHMDHATGATIDMNAGSHIR